MAELRQNTFGFNAGGPVDFWAKEHKTFFFYNMEWRKYINGNTLQQTVPLTYWYTGNFGIRQVVNVPIHGPGGPRPVLFADAAEPLLISKRPHRHARAAISQRTPAATSRFRRA